MPRAVLCLLVPLLAAAARGVKGDLFLGLKPPVPVHLGEGPTDLGKHLPGRGTLTAVMLFARFPDGEEDLDMQELYTRLVPEAQEFFRASSYGQLALEVEPCYEWLPMAGPSTGGDYDCSRYGPHRRYLEEAMAKAPADLDWPSYDAVYVVANRAPGVPNSPTFIASGDADLAAHGARIRHGVTFGNDIRGTRWGWQTLVHETGHILGLPDLYSYDRDPAAYKDIHRFTGAWDPMGFQCHAQHYLAWHKYKLGWLDDDDVHVAKRLDSVHELVHIGASSGLRALVVPVSETEALVAEVRHLSEGDPEPGVLVYRVSVTTASGRGPVQVLPARADDDERFPEKARSYIALYGALHGDGTTFEDPASEVSLEFVRLPDLEVEGGAVPPPRFRVTLRRGA